MGGGLLIELGKNAGFVRWLRTAQRVGRARRVPDDDVDAETEVLRSRRMCRSDDEHVLAMARLSGARLLFTNDNALQDDFRDRQIIGGATLAHKVGGKSGFLCKVEEHYLIIALRMTVSMYRMLRTRLSASRPAGPVMMVV